MNVFGFMLAFVLGVFFILVGPVALAGSVGAAFDTDRPKR